MNDGKRLLTDRVVIVTGATGSIGRQIALRCAQSGADVLVHGRSQESVGPAMQSLRAEYPDGRFHAAPADFLEKGGVFQLVHEADDRLGRLDGIINCAASAPPGILGPFAETDPDQYGELWVHAMVTLQQLCRAAIPVMERSGGGSFVAIASDAGLFAAPNQSMIGPTRAAMMNFCRNVSLEVARMGVRVNCLSTSYVEDTALFDSIVARGGKRPETARKKAGLGLPRPDDIAELALFLIGPGSARLTGQVISVNGGINA